MAFVGVGHIITGYVACFHGLHDAIAVLLGNPHIQVSMHKHQRPLEFVDVVQGRKRLRSIPVLRHSWPVDPIPVHLDQGVSAEGFARVRGAYARDGHQRNSTGIELRVEGHATKRLVASPRTTHDGERGRLRSTGSHGPTSSVSDVALHAVDGAVRQLHEACSQSRGPSIVHLQNCHAPGAQQLHCGIKAPLVPRGRSSMQEKDEAPSVLSGAR
mmetsp:Transcript_32325/g.89303  ORF Transcript_32325/g.89303 Transcript_32325/m.89303 type:complete len:214 (+) Transcript_32325:196-837(+)